jgi:hypothetical protein
MSYELAKKFAEFDMPADVKSAYKAGMPLIGSLSFTKMMMFANEVKLNNDDIDYFMALRPMRGEDETFEDFKSRSKFAKALYKYRAYLYDYSVFEKQN